MSYKSSLIKAAIKWTPKIMVLSVANVMIKGIAKLTDFKFDLETRTAFVRVLLYGEQEAVEICLQDFILCKEEDGAYRFIVQQAQANRPWLQQLLNRLAGKPWKIPATIKLTAYLELAVRLFNDEYSEQKDG